MAYKKVGKQTVCFANPPVITGFASVVGKKEGQGPLSGTFDRIHDDTTFGEATWEKAESRMQKDTLNLAAEKSGISLSAIEYLFGGDLLNQCIGTTFSVKDCGVPFFGLFGACSTMAEGLILASMMIDGGYAEYAAAVTSSHFCSAERQFRFPLEYGGQRPPTSQWTVTGAGGVILSSTGTGPKVTHATVGVIQDLGIKDANNMGAAMAPAAYDTISSFLSDTAQTPDAFDLIVTGDLGMTGKNILIELFKKDQTDIVKVYDDCGVMIFDKGQDVHSGGSGCGCSASVLCGYILSSLNQGLLHRVLFCGTGALMSPTSAQQGQSIPGICHLVCITSP